MQAAIPQISLRQVPLWAWTLVALLTLFVYALAYDQGLIEQAIHWLASNTLHEFFHDGRHLLGFPCH